MRTSKDILPPYGPAAEIYRSANRNLVTALLLIGGVIAGIAMAVLPGLDVGTVGFGMLDLVLGICISVFLASLLAIMLMYVNDVHSPLHLTCFTVAMHATAFGFYALVHFTDIHGPHPGPAQVGKQVCLNETS